ncbi:MAG: DUF805 domain-containing protein [Elusimicrobiaceae bacterium]|nr:DUF805 domain-containing protein [Elusimicrobiaceae bacterium]
MKHLFLWKGRAGRLEYLLVQIVTGAVVAMLEKFLSAIPQNTITDMTSMVNGLLVFLFVLAIVLVCAWVYYTAICRRFHDMDLSAWWFFAAMAFLFIFAAMREFVGVMAMNVLLSISPLFFILYPGTKGPNRFGPPTTLGDIFLSDKKSNDTTYTGPKQKVKTKEDGRIDFHL